MARAKHKLTAQMVEQAKTAGLRADGGGLFLQVTIGTDSLPRKSWLVRFRAPGGKVREMGLGSAGAVTLAKAREKARKARGLAADGIDPIEAEKERRAKEAAEAARAMTFKECALAYIDAHESSWKNAVHRRQWRDSLVNHVYKVFGHLPVQVVDTALVMKVIDPLWPTKTETAARLRMRIELILDWATVRGYRIGDNPARWRGHLQKALPPRSKVRRVKHFAALPYSEIPNFMAELRNRPGDGARALELTILAATRSNETLRARKAEFDLSEKFWVIPPERMKGGREHRVPLSARAIEIVKTQFEAHPDSQFVFPGASKKTKHKSLSDMAMLMTLRRMGRGDLTAHGFRSTFRDWAAEQTNFPREVAEAVLAHAIGDRVEAAYRRGDLFEKRKKIMEAWAGYCASPAATGQVVALRSAGKA
jgi:integrase